MHPVLKWILDHWAFVAFLISIIIQFTPAIKWNPFTALFVWIGKLANKSVVDQINNIKAELQDVKHRQQTNEKDRIRFEVLNFANSCRNKVKHTKDEFLHIIEINDKYKQLLNETNDSNGVFSEEYRYIMEIYRRCQQENSFLA